MRSLSIFKETNASFRSLLLPLRSFRVPGNGYGIRLDNLAGSGRGPGDRKPW